MLTDDIHEIADEVSALRTMASSIDPNSVNEDFGWGLSKLLDHVISDLVALKEKTAKMEAGQ